jgi:type VI secretion system protein ImpL
VVPDHRRPGSGKTTALRHSGLKFPLADAGDDASIRGVGGTRNCDWWFTDQAVLIDTAGRFTTQDSDRENDRATWNGFLAMLKRTRPRQPLNGVLVTVSVPDLLTRTLAERRQYAATVRQRLQELHEGLGIRFPIYLLVTKTDLVAGFTDTFTTIDKDQRATPWGATFPLEGSAAQNLQRFGHEFDLLVKRLEDGLVERLQTERDVGRRSRIYGFPGQFASLRGVLSEFLDVTFSSSPYEADALLRGVYFVSGTQEGTPIDRVLGAIARSYRLERAILAPNQASGRSFFLSRLLGEVVFAERGLANTDLKVERRRGALMIGAYAAIAVVTVGAIAAWLVSYANNRRYVDEVAQRVQQVRERVQTTPNRASPDLLPILPALAATRGLAGTTDSVPWSLGAGLYQGRKLDSAARGSYERMLVDAMLPRIGFRVEEQLRQASNASETQYEALKVYLMLHDVQHFDPEALKRYLANDWNVLFGRSLTEEERAQLDNHLTTLLAQGPVISPVPETRSSSTSTARGSRHLAAAAHLRPDAAGRRRQGHCRVLGRARGRQQRGDRLHAPERATAQQGSSRPLHVRRLSQRIPESAETDRRPARRRAGLGARRQGAAEGRRDARARRRAPARPGAPPLSQRVRAALGPVHRRHSPRADERRNHPADPDRSPALVRREPVAAADEGALARDDAAVVEQQGPHRQGGRQGNRTPQGRARRGHRQGRAGRRRRLVSRSS